jgi:hypothetical protein
MAAYSASVKLPPTRATAMANPINLSPEGCEDFQRQLPALIEAGADFEDHPHCKTCELCRALIDDLRTIAWQSWRRHNRDWEF